MNTISISRRKFAQLLGAGAVCADCVESKSGRISRMTYWEIIADRLSKAGWSYGCVSVRGFHRANDLDCRRTSRRRKAFRCACG
jgi:hypothetical protein